MKRYAALLGGLVLVVAACSTDQVRLGTPIDCDTEDRGRLILFAQAVPTAAAIPCLGPLPAGWMVDGIETRSGEALVVFENDTHDVDAPGRLTERCATTGVGELTGDVTLHRTNSGGWAAVFVGGCFAVEIPDVVTDEEVEALLAAISYLSRDELRELTGLTL